MRRSSRRAPRGRARAPCAAGSRPPPERRRADAALREVPARAAATSGRARLAQPRPRCAAPRLSRLAIDVHSRSPPPRRAASASLLEAADAHPVPGLSAASTTASVGATTAAGLQLDRDPGLRQRVQHLVEAAGSAPGRGPAPSPARRRCASDEPARAVGGAVQRGVVVHDGDAVRARVHVQLEVAEALVDGPAERGQGVLAARRGRRCASRGARTPGGAARRDRGARRDPATTRGEALGVAQQRGEEVAVLGDPRRAGRRR